MSNLRLIAARIVNDVAHGRSLSDKLETDLVIIKAERDRSLLKALCYGVCRTYPRLTATLNYLLKKPLKSKESDLQALLLVGVYQLMYMRIPPYAAISETVNAVKSLRKPWANGLVNATLREYLRKQDEIHKKLDSDFEAYYSHPIWWIDAIKKDWPNEWDKILKANNDHPPFSLRVNLNLLSRAQYQEKLAAKAIASTPLSEAPSGILLDEPVAVETLPGFFEGEVTVQDGAAQLAANLLKLKSNYRVLDACAAPGGKLTHMLEVEPKLRALIGVDKDVNRIEIIKANLARLERAHHQSQKYSVSLLNQDVSLVNDWWDGELFDRILIDAPCSASGVIRRHPDIKLLRRPTDIKLYAMQQAHLLTTLWPLLKNDGLLVYATCSIFREENENVLKGFLSEQHDAKEIKIEANWGIACDIGRQILPGMHQMDGFYYAIISKQKYD